GWTVLNGTFSAENQMLSATSSGEFCSIQHSSSVDYGNWSLDYYHNPNVSISQTALVCIMADELVKGEGVYADTLVPLNGYSLDFWVLGTAFNLWIDGAPHALGGFSTTFSGWRTITITRDRSGHFEIYLNETLEEELENATLTTSELFSWSTRPGNAIDNVIVTELEPSTIALDPLLIGAGIAIVVVIIAIVVYVRRR
ncbi:MAG: hypothetical protein ACFFF4_12835, partial [Candidatus Thorarchaeota archaeon]